ncbi:XRE family transcriptional regulator [Bradyrhizobium niftali]|jgi:predicted DNA-binding transcriptional regulator AlpA|uniref:XRE family transcriptional regulator n=1 Tax=Bradyrhizobium niftali TaxID=2560055 RepID=A0A4Y9LD89_9BRAD|nr:XRE family transcriptional regulator [Bradyrhizobium niftali]
MSLGTGALSPRAASAPRFAMRRDEAAASVAVSPSKFDEWVKDGRMPKGRKIDGVVLWDVGQVREAWEALRDNPADERNPFDEVVA